MPQIQVLVIDDEADVCTFLQRLLTKRGYGIRTATNERQALQALEENSFAAALVDMKMPDTDGLTLLQQIKTRQPACEVIIMTGYSTVKTAVRAIQLGAYEYLEKPFDEIDLVERVIEKATASSRDSGRASREEWLPVAQAVGLLVGPSPAMRRLLSVAYKIADKNISVLIQGETGTGKEVLARFIHAASDRSDQPFLPMNCGALPDNLLESELFGHEKGAFTGASTTRRGIFELANRGTLFLDEIGEASPAIQVKLLRVLETGEFMRVGGEKPIRSDVRVISATNVELEDAIRERTFRDDLFFRLNVVRLEIPPLRERREDIALLAEHFVRQFSPELSLSPAALQALSERSWPGNVRELVNIIRRASALCQEATILPEHLGSALKTKVRETAALPHPEEHGQASTVPARISEKFWDRFSQEEVLNEMSPGELNQMLHSLQSLQSQLLKVMRQKGLRTSEGRELKDSELEMIRSALERNHWNITQSARALGIGRNTLHRKIKKYKLRNL